MLCSECKEFYPEKDNVYFNDFCLTKSIWAIKKNKKGFV